jgi:hypothetical protein
MKISKKVTSIIILALLASIIIWGYLRKIDSISKLRKNYLLITGDITDIWVQHKSGNCYAKYQFQYLGQHYTGEREISGISSSNAFKFFKGKNFPILVDTTDPSNNAILATPFHFEKMEWPLPDSLEWVRKYYSHNFWADW